MKWEYQQLDAPDNIHIKRLGEEGWELITVAYIPSGRSNTLVYFFKRPLEEKDGVELG